MVQGWLSTTFGALYKIKKALDTYFSKNIKNGFAGSVLVSKEGRIILSKGYGFSDIEKKIPNTSNTIFDIGSNTKQFTATAILKLVELKKLKLSDSLHIYFKNIPNDKKDITIHQLLTHSSGLPPYSGNDFDIISKKDFLQSVFRLELVSTPGPEYNYSNVGIVFWPLFSSRFRGKNMSTF